MSIQRYLADHHDVVDLAALETLGHSREVAYANVAARRWQRVHPAVFCGHTGPLTFVSRCRAALLSAGTEAALDAATAAEIHGLRGYEHQEIEIVVPHERRLDRRPDVVVRRSRTLTSRSVVLRDGLPVVTVERAVLAVALTRRSARPGVLAAAVQQGLTTPGRLRGCLLGLGRVNDKRAVLRVLDDMDGGSRSWLESRSGGCCVRPACRCRSRTTRCLWQVGGCGWTRATCGKESRSSWTDARIT